MPRQPRSICGPRARPVALSARLRAGRRLALGCLLPALALLSARAVAKPAGVVGVSTSDTSAPGLSELSTDVVYAASKRLQHTDQAPAIVRVFTRQEIQKRGFRSLNELLASIPEVELVNTSREQYLLFKGTPFTVLALLDGVSLVNHGDNLVNLDRLVPLEMVRKVEVVLSPGGVLWGAHALFGIVNIITRELTDRQQIVLSAGGGWWKTFRGAGTAYGAWRDLRWQLHFSLESSQNPTLKVEDSIFSPGQYGNRGETDNDRSLYVSTAARLSWRDVWLRGFFNRRDHAYPIAHITGARQTGGSNSELVRSTYLLSGGYEHTFKRERLELWVKGTLYAFDQPYRNDEYQLPPSPVVPNGLLDTLTIAHQQRLAALLETQLRYGDWSTHLGLDAIRSGLSDVIQRGRFPDGQTNEAVVVSQRATHELSLYAQQEWKALPALSLAGGGRLNISDSYTTAAFAHGHLVYEPIDGLFAKLNYSEGFRPPSFEQRFLEAKVANLAGATDLDPERARAAEAQLVFNTPLGQRLELRLEGNYSFVMLSDLIGVPDTASRRFSNRADEQMHTLAWSARLRLTSLGTLSAAYAYHFPADDSEGQPRRDFARERLTLSATVEPLSLVSASIEYAFTGRRYIRDYVDLSSGDTLRLTVGAFHELALSARARLWNTGLILSATLRNVLVRDYDHIPPYTRIAQIYRGLFPQPATAYGFLELTYLLDI